MMHLAQDFKVATIRQEFRYLNLKKQFVTDKSGVKMLEIQGACFTADEDSIFGTVNTDYVQRELDWYTSMSLCVNDIPGGKQEANPPVIWTTVSDSNGMINSNYNYIRHHIYSSGQECTLNCSFKILITSNFTTEPPTQQSQTTSKQSK